MSAMLGRGAGSEQCGVTLLTHCCSLFSAISTSALIARRLKSHYRSRLTVNSKILIGVRCVSSLTTNNTLSSVSVPCFSALKASHLNCVVQTGR